MNGSVCVLMFVFCVCLTAVILSGLFANMLIHERLQAYQKARTQGGMTPAQAGCFMAALYGT